MASSAFVGFASLPRSFHSLRPPFLHSQFPRHFFWDAASRRLHAVRRLGNRVRAARHFVPALHWIEDPLPPCNCLERSRAEGPLSALPIKGPSHLSRPRFAVQGRVRKWAPYLVDFVPAVAYHLCLNLIEIFMQPGDHFLANPCMPRAM